MVQEKRNDLAAQWPDFFWNEVPDRWEIVGAAVIIASGEFVAFWEIGSAVSSRYLRASTAAVASAIKSASPRD